MGCDIYLWYERRNADGVWEQVQPRQACDDDPWGACDPFDWRSYAMFGFLAGVRNIAAVQPLAEGRGWPDDTSADDDRLCLYKKTWLSIEELTAIDPNTVVENRRVTIGNDGGCTCAPGKGRQETLLEFLGPAFFASVESCRAAGIERVLLGFTS